MRRPVTPRRTDSRRTGATPIAGRSRTGNGSRYRRMWRDDAQPSFGFLNVRSSAAIGQSRQGALMGTALAPACGPWEQAVGGQKFDHVAVEQRRLLDLAGMAGAVEHLQLAAGDALL